VRSVDLTWFLVHEVTVNTTESGGQLSFTLFLSFFGGKEK